MRKFAESIKERINPNVFITLTVRQGITNDRGVYIAGDREVYDRVMVGLYKSTGRRLSKGRQKRKMIENLSTVERGIFKRNHIHSCARIPDGVTFEEFRDALIASWERSKWSLPLHDIQIVTGNAVNYIVKEGQESLLLSATHAPISADSAP